MIQFKFKNEKKTIKSGALESRRWFEPNIGPKAQFCRSSANFSYLKKQFCCSISKI